VVWQQNAGGGKRGSGQRSIVKRDFPSSRPKNARGDGFSLAMKSGHIDG
jgi:hypothetical protein